MARLRDRIFAIVTGLMFLGSSLGVTGIIIWQMVQDNNAKKNGQPTQSEITNAIKQQGKNMQDFAPVAKIDSLQTVDLQAGTGEEAKAGATVTVDYTGAVAATGVIFQSSLDMGQPVSFSLDGVIEGWKEGIPGMKVGGKRRLLIPAVKAYGANPPQGSGIPANADLVFDVTLRSIGQAQTQQ
jgi:FKBP-type peptidyl-prolyl cis-trans isomerase